MYKVLLVDDYKEILIQRSKIIEEFGYDCVTAKDGQEAVDIFNDVKPNIVLTDQKMPKKDGLYLLKKVKEIDPNLPVIIFTGYGDVTTAVKAMKMEAFDYLQKPLSNELLEVVLQKAVNQIELQKENVYLKSQLKQNFQFKNFIGNSKVINDIVKKVLKVAQSEANVFVYGESGTGKELIARNIHFYSKRKEKSFIPLDCVALPATLIEGEVFGYEKGAFTGAVKAKPGILELAEGGTLFLDEISELDLNLQAKLLRVIQEKEFRRLGSNHLIKTDFRIVAATNMKPQDAVKENKLRSDLYYRLNVVPIHIPPLRDRKEDIPLLVQHLIDNFNPSCSINVKSISGEAMRTLKKYDWPGNVRELQNVIEHAMSMTDKEMIEYETLPQYVKEIEEYSFDPSSYEDLNFKQAKDRILNLFSKTFIKHLMQKHDNNISKVARKAGISRWTVYRILNNYDQKQ